MMFRGLTDHQSAASGRSDMLQTANMWKVRKERANQKHCNVLWRVQFGPVAVLVGQTKYEWARLFCN